MSADDSRKRGDAAWAEGDKMSSDFWHRMASNEEARARKAAGGDGCSCYVRLRKLAAQTPEEKELAERDTDHHPLCGEYVRKW